jgi:cytochrome c553
MDPKPMMKRNGLLALGAAATILMSATAWAEGDPARGQARAQMCEGCHGIVDYRTAYPQVYPVPKIGGQGTAYIVKSLQDYKTGARKHPTMRGIAATLSDQDMADLAAYYTGKAPLSTGTTPASDGIGKKKADEACAACHGPEGNKPITPETPRLADQQYGYLVQALTDYHNGTRDNAVMSAMAKPLTEKEIRDLATYFSTQQGLTTKR